MSEPTEGGEVKPPLGCDYQGQEFGAANYPDSVCIDGYLWDADSGNADPSGDGWIYTNGGDIPCPKCNAEAHAEHYRYEDEAESLWQPQRCRCGGTIRQQLLGALICGSCGRTP